MVSSAISEKRARVSFSKTFKAFFQTLSVSEKLTSAYFSQIAREIILLLVNTVKECFKKDPEAGGTTSKLIVLV